MSKDPPIPVRTLEETPEAIAAVQGRLEREAEHDDSRVPGLCLEAAAMLRRYRALLADLARLRDENAELARQRDEETAMRRDAVVRSGQAEAAHARLTEERDTLAAALTALREAAGAHLAALDTYPAHWLQSQGLKWTADPVRALLNPQVDPAAAATGMDL